MELSLKTPFSHFKNVSVCIAYSVTDLVSYDMTFWPCKYVFLLSSKMWPTRMFRLMDVNRCPSHWQHLHTASQPQWLTFPSSTTSRAGYCNTRSTWTDHCISTNNQRSHFSSTCVPAKSCKIQVRQNGWCRSSHTSCTTTWWKLPCSCRKTVPSRYSSVIGRGDVSRFRSWLRTCLTLSRCCMMTHTLRTGWELQWSTRLVWLTRSLNVSREGPLQSYAVLTCQASQLVSLHSCN